MAAGEDDSMCKHVFLIFIITVIMSPELRHDFPKMRGGGVKGRLELFRKFIHFGLVTRPLAHHINYGGDAHDDDDDDDDFDGFTTT